MLNLYNILEVNSVASSVNKIQNQPDDLKEAMKNADFIDDIDGDIASSITRSLIRAEISSQRQFAANATTAISTIQVFDEAVDSIDSILNQMAELAYKSAGSSQSYTADEKAEMQTQFNKLAGDINNIVNTTESDGNKLLTADGQTVSASIGAGKAVRIFPMDLSIDVDRLDLSIAHGGPGLAVVKAEMEQAGNYKQYLNDQIRQLEKISNAIDLDITGITGGDSDLQKALTINKAAEMVNQIIESTRVLLQAHTSVDADMALQLLG